MGFIYLFICLFSENKIWVLNFFLVFLCKLCIFGWWVCGFCCWRYRFDWDFAFLVNGCFWIVELWLVGMDYWLKCFFSYVCLFWLLLFLFLSMFLCYLCGQSDLYCRKSLNFIKYVKFLWFLVDSLVIVSIWDWLCSFTFLLTMRKILHLC